MRRSRRGSLSRKRQLTIFYAVLGSVFVLGAIFFIRRDDRNLDCVISREKRVVQGESLKGVLEPGATIRVLKSYYACHPVARGDIVVYYYPGARDPLVKLAMAIPGDSFALKKQSDGSFEIFVNGAPLLSPRGKKPYSVTSGNYPRFHLYEQDYGKELPSGVYMLLGTDSKDSFDSRVFGLANVSDFIGKAELL